MSHLSCSLQILEGAECVEYGARAINEGGVQRCRRAY